MNLIVTYITKSAINWAGFEIDENIELPEDVTLLGSTLKGKIRVLESGSIKRKSETDSENTFEDKNPESEVSREHTTDEPGENFSIESITESTAGDKPQKSYDTGIGFLAAEITTDVEIELPFSDKKKAEKVIPFQIQDRLPFDVPDSHTVIYFSPGDSGNLYKYFYSAIEKKELSEILYILKTHDIKLCSLHPEIHAGNALFHLGKSDQKDQLKVFLLEKEDAIIFSSATERTLFNTRHIRVSSDPAIITTQVNAQLAISFQYLFEQSETSKNRQPEITLFHIPFPNSLIDFEKTSDHFKRTYVPLSIEEIIPKEENKISCALLTMGVCAYLGVLQRESGSSLLDYQLPKSMYPNIRSGEFRYRAPLTEIKNSFYNELVPFSLLIFFAVLTALLGFILTPLKQYNLDQEKINSIALGALGSNSIPKGRELSMLEDRVYELENELGDMSIIQSLSSVEWLHLLSSTIPGSIPLELDNISITTKGISFRGTVPDYPTSGRVSSLLESLKSKRPDKFCTVELKTEDVAIGVSSKQIRAEVTLCD